MRSCTNGDAVEASSVQQWGCHEERSGRIQSFCFLQRGEADPNGLKLAVLSAEEVRRACLHELP